MLIKLFLLSFISTANAADIDQPTLDTLAHLQTEIQDLQAERDALAAQCATRCKSAAAPAHKPKATTAPKPVPAPAPVATASQPDPHTAEIAALKAEIAELREALRASLDRPIVINVSPTPVIVEAPNVDIHPTVVEHTEHTEHTETIVTGSRVHVGVGETVTGAPPLPGSNLVAVDTTEVFARAELKLGRGNWATAEVDAGLGFAEDSTSIRGLLGYTRNVGPFDLSVSAGPSYRCTAAFTDGPLCTNSLFGGLGQASVALHVIGPINVEVLGGGGYSAVDSKYAGRGGTGYGYGGVRLFVGEVGETETETVH